MPAAVTSEVEVANWALSRIGVGTISALDEDTEVARCVLRVFYLIRNALFREYRWNFAIKRVELAEDPTVPEFGKGHRFQVPSDYIRFLEPDPIDNFTTRDWVEEGGYILTDFESPLQLRYLARVEAPNQWDDLFVELFALKLAESICMPLTDSRPRLEGIVALRTAVEAKARAANSLASVATKRPEDTYLTVRRSGFGDRWRRP